jgi:hypothetical protein
MGGSGKSLKEVSFISYDEDLQTLVVVFSQNYTMTVNVDTAVKRDKHSIECDCHNHLEITNFTITNIEVDNTI